MDKLLDFMYRFFKLPQGIATIATLAFAIASFYLFGAFSFGTEPVKEEKPEEKPVVSLLSDHYLNAYQRDTSKLNLHSFDLLYVPQYADSTYQSRLQQIQATIPLTFNREVKGFINLYLFKKRALVTRIIGRSYDYYPMFEEKLRERGMPDELKHLAIVESALNPEAKSWAGAYGLWQFIPSTAKLYKLRVDDEVDERTDPHLSTDAALSFLSDLYSKYGDWHLTITAYNCGPGNVNKAIKKAQAAGKKKDFWSIKPYLPKETQSYVPAFIAACYFMNYFPDHNLRAIDPHWYSVDWVEVEVKDNLVLNELASTLKLRPEELASFNPILEKKPQLIVGEPGVCINLPVSLHHIFYSNEDEIYQKSNCVIEESLPVKK